MVRDVGIRVVLRIFASLAQLGTLTLLARDFGPASFVVFATITAAAAVASSVITIGLPTAALRVRGFDDARSIAYSILVLLTFTYLGLGLSIALFTHILAVPIFIIIAATIAIVSDGVNDAAQWALTGLERHSTAGWLMVGRRTLTLAIVASFAIAEEPVAQGFAVGCTLSLIVPLILILRWHTERSSWRVTYKLGFRYWPQNVLNATWSLDVPVAASVMSAASGAAYAVGSRFAAPLTIVVQSIVAIATPRLVVIDDLGVRLAVWRKLRLAGLVYGAILVATSPLIAYAATHLLGPDYRDAQLVITSVCIASAISAISQVYISWELAQGLARSINFATSIGIAVGLGSLALLGTSFDVAGAAAAPIVTQLIILVILMQQTDSRGGQVTDESPTNH